MTAASWRWWHIDDGSTSLEQHSHNEQHAMTDDDDEENHDSMIATESTFQRAVPLSPTYLLTTMKMMTKTTTTRTWLGHKSTRRHDPVLHHQHHHWKHPHKTKTAVAATMMTTLIPSLSLSRSLDMINVTASEHCARWSSAANSSNHQSSSTTDDDNNMRSTFSTPMYVIACLLLCVVLHQQLHLPAGIITPAPASLGIIQHSNLQLSTWRHD